MVWPALISAGASVLGGAIKAKSQKDSNNTNVALAKASQRFNRKEAEKNRAFQVLQVNEARAWDAAQGVAVFERNRRENNSQRKYNRKQERQTRNYNREQVEDEREWAVEQNDVAYQRSRADVRDAREFDVAQIQDQRDWSIEQSDIAYNRSKVDVREARAWDRSQVLDARSYDRDQIVDARTWSRKQVREAREWDRSQVIDKRNYDEEALDRNRRKTYAREDVVFQRNKNQARGAERRGRRYMKQDRAEHRAYNDPAAMRERLENAGFNPMTGVDPSGAFVGGASSIMGPAATAARSAAAASALASSSVASTGMSSSGAAASGVPSSYVPTTNTASSAVPTMGVPGVTGARGVATHGAAAQAIAAQSGVASGTVANAVTATTTPVDGFAGGLGEAIDRIEQAHYAEKEQALAETQMAIENRRITELVNRASMRNSVPGIYGPQTSTSTVHHTYDAPPPAAAPSGAAAAEPGSSLATEHPMIGDREIEVSPSENFSGGMIMQSPLTNNKPVWLPGSDGDVMDPGQVMTTIGVGYPQVVWQTVSESVRATKDHFNKNGYHAGSRAAKSNPYFSR